MIHKLITPIGLAIWFMDDGSRKSLRHKTYIFHTLGYAKQELELVTKALNKCFSVNTKLHRQKENYWRIYILSESSEQFKKIVEPYIKNILSMKNKLSNTLPKK